MNDEQKGTENDWQAEGESLNTSSADKQNTSAGQAEEHKEKKGGIHNNALFAASMGHAATAQVDPHSNSGLAQTGTNTSYEGPTAPGAGGSVGNGYTSGQSGVDSSITTESDYDQARVESSNKNSDELNNEDDDDAKNTLI